MKNIKFMVLVLAFAFAGAYAFAEAAVVTPQDFFTQVLQAVTSMGGLAWMLKVAAVVTLLISSMKVTLLNDLIWSKLGSLQAWAAPVLGLVGGILSLAGGGTLSLPNMLAWLSAGAGAIVLHELLDTIKAVPGLGPVYVGIIDAIESALGGPNSASSQARRKQPVK